jgi:uncharacterized protein
LAVIVDAHLHVDEVAALGWKMGADLCIERMNEAEIEVGLIMTITDLPQFNPHALELILKACEAFPGRLFAFARLHPWYGDEAVRLLEHALTDHRTYFRGLKLHPVSTIAHPSGEDTHRLIRKAAELGAPTLFHCGDEPFTTPLAIASAAAACPEATIILGHMGGYFHVDEAIDTAERFPNLVLETSAMPYPGKIAEAVHRLGPERVMYGSDGPVCSPRIEVEKVRLAKLGETAEKRVLCENAERIFGEFT